jgi:hypothetical protein
MLYIIYTSDSILSEANIHYSISVYIKYDSHFLIF